MTTDNWPTYCRWAKVPCPESACKAAKAIGLELPRACETCHGKPLRPLMEACSYAAARFTPGKGLTELAVAECHEHHELGHCGCDHGWNPVPLNPLRGLEVAAQLGWSPTFEPSDPGHPALPSWHVHLFAGRPPWHDFDGYADTIPEAILEALARLAEVKD